MLGNLLKKRFLRPEMMDDPALDALSHETALRGLKRINAVSGAAGQIFRAISTFTGQASPKLKILDIASGGGDVPIALAEIAARRGVPVAIHGCDKSSTAVRYAQAQADRKKIPIQFFQLDATQDALPATYDVIISSLFLHHLPVLKTLKFLKKIASSARLGIILNDLRRCWPGYILASWTPLLTSSRIVHRDGVQSVRAAYSLDEIRRLTERAGLRGAEIRKAWPFRYQVVWRKS